ncbi:MAG: cytochrome c biogenesis protein CcsA, partial [Opitutaceae bacterium]|nr:cytochrome c biogenesis protein CcsA [Verrucomicrobiales bacterium]
MSSLRPVTHKEGFDVAAFGRLPVLLNGRVQPFDSVARNSLLNISGKSVVRLEPKGKMEPTEWLLNVMTRPDVTDKLKFFRVEHPDLEGLLGTVKPGLVYYSFDQLRPELEKLEEQARQRLTAENKKEADVQTRTPYQKDLIHLYNSIILYHRLKNSLQPEGAENFVEELKVYQNAIPSGVAAITKSEKGEEHNAEDLKVMAGFFRRYQSMARFSYPLIVPPQDPVAQRDAWASMGDGLMSAMRDGQIPPAINQLAAMSVGFKEQKPADFNRAIIEYRQLLEGKKLQTEIKKGRQEYLFNQLEPFYKSMVIYVGALLLGCFYWLNGSENVRRTAAMLLSLAFVIHTAGLLFRMFLEGRPPVTNLYSSAVFVGWGAVLLGLILERIHKGSIGIVVAGAVGFITQIIAHHLSLSGDTMEMLQAVLDTNIWLATHVVVITIGYSSMFVAGLLAIIYILRGFFTKSLSEQTAKSLGRMVYGVICFSTLFSFVGTILGGIWADQSWGRFWGWDPKENGALLIVIWCAVVLHARWGGMIRERGLMVAALVGNIITSFSWFGVNMLGIGLHSYGFMDAAFKWLMLFIASQLILIVIGLLPSRLWASFNRPP